MATLSAGAICPWKAEPHPGESVHHLGSSYNPRPETQMWEPKIRRPSFYDPELSCGPSCQNIGTYHLAGIGRRSMSFDESERLGYLAQPQ